MASLTFVLIGLLREHMIKNNKIGELALKEAFVF